MVEAAAERREELRRRTEAVGDGAWSLLRQFTRQEIGPGEVQEGLRALGAEAIMSSYWDVLTTEADSAGCHEVLQIISSLAADLEHQVRTYGETSLWDDREQLKHALRRLRGDLPTA
ncbi:MAG: hypothetical protein KKI08_19685 [Armatimonadetes bacterium]|nr:hypothetical protein [Armatimonadota bacterium]